MRRRSRSRDPEASRHRIEDLFRKARRHPDARAVLHDVLLETFDLPWSQYRETSLGEGYARVIRQAEDLAQSVRRKRYVHFWISHRTGYELAISGTKFKRFGEEGADFGPSVLVYTTRAGYLTKPTQLELLRDELPAGWTVHTYSPGDGVTRYAFFYNAPPNQRYFGPANANRTLLGLGRAKRFAEQLRSEP